MQENCNKIVITVTPEHTKKPAYWHKKSQGVPGMVWQNIGVTA